jgi:hypothetical protein
MLKLSNDKLRELDMLGVVDSIIHEQEAMCGQIEFLKGYTSKWKDAPDPKENDLSVLNQLILTTYYLKEGLEDLYGQSDDFMLSNLAPSAAGEIKFKHETVMNSLDEVYRSLVELTSTVLRLNKESLSETIQALCQLITLLSIQENNILKAHIN